MTSSLEAHRLLRPRDLRRFQSFRFAAKLIVEGFYAGRHRSPYHDASAEFADYRPYIPGDDVHSLDWRAYARTDRDYIKLFRKETDMQCHILLDASGSMAFREPAFQETSVSRNSVWHIRRRPAVAAPPPVEPAPEALTKFEYGAYLAAGLAHLMIRQGDRAGVALGSNQLSGFVAPGGTIPHLHNLVHTLETAEAAGETDIAASLRSLFALARKRGMLIVLSDFLEEPAPLFSALSMFAHRGWHILLLHILTEAELNLPDYGGTARFRDTEGPDEMDADPDSMRAAYRAEMRAFVDDIESQARARRIHYVRITPETPFDQALERYLTARTQSGR